MQFVYRRLNQKNIKSMLTEGNVGDVPYTFHFKSDGQHNLYQSIINDDELDDLEIDNLLRVITALLSGNSLHIADELAICIQEKSLYTMLFYERIMPRDASQFLTMLSDHPSAYKSGWIVECDLVADMGAIVLFRTELCKRSPQCLH